MEFVLSSESDWLLVVGIHFVSPRSVLLLSSESELLLVVGIHFVSPRYDPLWLTGQKTSSIYLSISLALRSGHNANFVHSHLAATACRVQRSCAAVTKATVGWWARWPSLRPWRPLATRSVRLNGAVWWTVSLSKAVNLGVFCESLITHCDCPVFVDSVEAL